MEASQPISDDNVPDLVRSVRELAALSSLSADWSGTRPQGIAEGLADLLWRSLPLRFSYVRVYGPAEREVYEAARPHAGSTAAGWTREIGQIEADRRKDEFLALLGHELRNPLATIVNGMEVVLRRGGPADNEQRVHELVYRQSQHMKRLIDDLLDVSRIARGKIALQIERLDLAGLLLRVAEDDRSSFEDAQLTLSVDLPPQPLWVDGDETRLAQIAGNLLHNARKFTEPGGRITLSARSDLGQSCAVVTVKDSGVGMNAATVAGLFQPFSRSAATLDRDSGGLGLGLSVVKGLAELHGGSVHAHSEGPGCGSVFIIRLPLAPRPSAIRESARPAEAPPAGSRFRVLVVDDSRPVAEIFAMMLRDLNSDVHVVASGPDAIEHIRESRPDIVFSDISMPGMSGYELARRLRCEDGANRLFLVAMTGFGQPSDRQQALEAGFDEHLVKPIETERLRQVLSEAARRLARRERFSDRAGTR